jgi:hypothetical protein
MVTADQHALSVERIAIPNPLLVPREVPTGNPGPRAEDSVAEFPGRGEVSSAHALDPTARIGPLARLGIVHGVTPSAFSCVVKLRHKLLNVRAILWPGKCDPKTVVDVG